MSCKDGTVKDIAPSQLAEVPACIEHIAFGGETLDLGSKAAHTNTCT